MASGGAHRSVVSAVPRHPLPRSAWPPDNDRPSLARLQKQGRFSGVMCRPLKQLKRNRSGIEMLPQQPRNRLHGMEATHDQLLHLADGSKVVIRAIRFEDGPRLQGFVRRLSARSRYLRFFSAIIELSGARLERLLRLDPQRGLALVALSDHEPEVIVAEARCVIDREGRSAEFALAVADEFQRRRLGTQLLARLLAYASAKGVGRLFGEIMVDNHAMLAFVRRLGFHIRSNPLDATTLIAQRMPSVPADA